MNKFYNQGLQDLFRPWKESWRRGVGQSGCWGRGIVIKSIICNDSSNSSLTPLLRNQSGKKKKYHMYIKIYSLQHSISIKIGLDPPLWLRVTLTAGGPPTPPGTAPLGAVAPLQLALPGAAQVPGPAAPRGEASPVPPRRCCPLHQPRARGPVSSAMRWPGWHACSKCEHWISKTAGKKEGKRSC